MKRETKRKQSLQRKQRARLNKKTKRKSKIKQSKKQKKNIKKKRKTKKGGRATPRENIQSRDLPPPLTHRIAEIVNEDWEPSVSSEETPTVLDDRSFDTFESFSENNDQDVVDDLVFLISFLDDPAYEEEVKNIIRRFPDHLEGVFEADTLSIVMSRQGNILAVRDAGNKLKRVIEMYVIEKIPTMEPTERAEYVEKIMAPISEAAARRLLDFHTVDEF